MVELEKQTPVELSELSMRERRKKDAPSPIALEPCEGSRAAVLSLLVRLPTGKTADSVTGSFLLTILMWL